MEPNINPNLLSFSQFYSEFSECLRLQEWCKVNNRPLSAFLKDSPEVFFEYLLQILSGSH